MFTDTGTSSTIKWTNSSVTDLVGRTVSVQTAGAGFSASTKASTSATIELSYPDSSGTTRWVEVLLQTMSFSCPSNQTGVGDEAGINGVTFNMPTAIILPNALTYTFQYDSCGALTKVTYPTGGYTRFVYSSIPMELAYPGGGVFTYFQNEVNAKYVCPAETMAYGAVTAAPGNNCPVPEEKTTYAPTYYQSLNGNSNTQNIVTDPVGNFVYYEFSVPNEAGSIPALETGRYYYNASGSLLKTVTTQYSTTATPGSNLNGESGGWPAVPTIQTTTLNNGMASQIQWSYDLQNMYSNDSVLTEERVYDYGSGAPGPLIKRTDYTWLHRVDPDDYGWPGGVSTGGQLRAHICDRKSSETVYDGSGKMVAQTNNVYDYGSPTTYGAHGLLTSEATWRSTDGATLTTSYQYGSLYGYATQKTDPKGNITTYSYADNYADGINRNSYAFLTKTVDPLGHVTQNQYYWGSGLVAATCGNNFSGNCDAGLTSGADYASYTYDLLGRQLTATTGDGAETTTTYLVTNYVSSYLVQVETVNSIGVNTLATLDGEGKTTRSALLSDPNCSGGTVNVDTTYDLDERKSTVTNPYCSSNTGAPTSGTTTYAYDGLSRITQITNPDGTYATNTYTGRAVLSADEGNGTDRIQRISQTDTMGRLIYVCEVTTETQQGSNNTPSSCGLDISGSGFLTTYGYDAANSNGPLGSLTSVTQGGMSRSFVYDSVGELRTATNPESGTTTYAYDNNGNLTSKTDAKGITTTYAYDALNRLTGKSYNDGVTPSACFQYDQTASARGVGRLTTEWTQTGTCPAAPPSSGVLTQRTFAAYDPLGRVKIDEQCATLNNCGAGVYALNYSYDLAGDVTSFNNGLSGSAALSFYGAYSTAGRLSEISGSETPGGSTVPLFQATGYTPAGALSNATMSTGTAPSITFERSYNSRLLPISETDTSDVSGESIASITFAGTELSKTSGGTVTYDGGQFLFQIFYGSGACSSTTSFGEGSTEFNLATNMAAAINSYCSEWVTATVSGPVVNITSVASGTAADYGIGGGLSGYCGCVSGGPSFSMSLSGSTMTGGGPPSLPLYSWAINSYAPNGDVLSMTDAVMGTWSYAYDDFNRLTSGSATAGVDDGLSLGWTYDRYGNRWAQNATGSGNAGAVQPQLTFGNANRVSGWSYDADGNLLNDGRNNYTYDAEGRVINLNGALTYLYDAEGRRVAKYSGSSISASYLLDLGGHQVTELNSAGTWMHSNVWAGDRLVATYEGSGESKPNTWHFHLTDWLSTQRMQTTAAGNQEEVCYSYPFGDGLTCSGTDATEHHFTSKERDVESGLDYFYARYYSSDLARFMTPDWAGAPTAVPYATFGDPQTLNLYAYVNNNPNTGIDLNGHMETINQTGCFDPGNGDPGGGTWGNSFDPTNPAQGTAAGPGSSSGSTPGSNNSTGSGGQGSLPKAAKPKAPQPDPQKQGTSNTTTVNGTSNTTNQSATSDTTTANGTSNTAAPNNGSQQPQQPADPTDKCKAEAQAAANQQPSMLPNQSSLLSGVMGYIVTLARTGSQKAGWQGFVIGNLLRPAANAYLQSAAYTNTMQACMAAIGGAAFVPFNMAP